MNPFLQTWARWNRIVTTPNPPMRKDFSIDTLLSNAQLAIGNALNTPQILEYLSDFGYTSAKIQQGKNLYNLAAAAQLTRQAEAGEQICATTDVNAAWETAKKTYSRLVKVARIAFKRNSGVTTQLDLGGTRKKSLSGWMAQSTQFYKNALNNKEILVGLKEFGITEKKLKAGLSELAAVEKANLTQEKEKGEAQAATKKRDAALDELQDWLSDFLAIAKIALEEEPQLLESLGVLVRS
ncbi:MAG: hypothetical protein AAFQ63_20445 [Cyanobacteria bacterium J06621_11]